MKIAHRLELPAVLLGSLPDVLDSVRREGRREGRSFQASGTFVGPALVPVEPGTVLFTNAPFGDLDDRGRRWRIYLGWMLRTEALDAIPNDLKASFEDAYASWSLASPWGALCTSLSNAYPNSADAVAERIEALVSSWSELDLARYAILHDSVVTFTVFVEDLFGHVLAMWGSRSNGDLRARLCDAARAMAAASEDEVRARVIERLVFHATSEPGLARHARLHDRAVLAEAIDTMDRAAYRDLTSGYPGSLLRVLHLLARRA